MKKIFLLLLLPSFALAGIVPYPLQPPAQFGNVKISCKELDDFEQGKFDLMDSAFGVRKEYWDGGIKAYISKVAGYCAQTSINNMLASGHLVTSTQNKIYAWVDQVNDKVERIVNQNQRADAAVEAQKIAAAQAERARQIAAADAQRKDIIAAKAACEDTDKYKLYFAERSVVADIDQIADWRRNQAKEAEIVRVSGVRDLAEERNNGEWIVQLRSDLKVAFADYKRLGGKAANPNSVKLRLSDPCSSPTQ